jgi:hypothetical protein
LKKLLEIVRSEYDANLFWFPEANSFAAGKRMSFRVVPENVVV